MATEKSIERYYADFDSDAAAPNGQRIEMVPDPDGSWVDWDDHLDALGEAQLQAADLRIELELSEKSREQAEEELRTEQDRVDELKRAITYIAGYDVPGMDAHLPSKQVATAALRNLNSAGESEEP